MSSFNEDDAFEAAVQPQRPSLSQLAMQGAREAAFGAPDTSYLDTLNDAQREAVETLDGPVLMLAGFLVNGTYWRTSYCSLKY